MSISFSKLEKFLSVHNMTIVTFYTINSLAIYLQVFDKTTVEMCFIYIPSKYVFSSRDYNKKTFRLKYVDIGESGNIPEDYGNIPDDFTLQKQYSNIDIDTTSKGKNMEDFLHENYKHELSLKDMNKNDVIALREIQRQLKRLTFCVQNLYYKICIVYKEYICCIQRDNSIEIFNIRGYKGSDKMKLYINIDLESLYTKIENLTDDIKTVRQGIYNIITNNQVKHNRNLVSLLEQQSTFSNYINIINEKKEIYQTELINLEKLLEKSYSQEQEKRTNYNSLIQKYNNKGGSVNNDAEKSYITKKYQQDLEKINSARLEIIQNIDNTKTSYDNLILFSDKTYFDSTIMVDNMIKNFTKLNKWLE